ncbi:sulfite exporter TauE/SafE family protein [Enterococcus sp. LJL99]
MKLLLIYFITIFLSNTVGALSGMGGGVIIKPVLDFIGYHSLSSIAFYSSVAVFTMSISSTFKQIQNGIQIELKKATGISLGSLLGGVLGDHLLSFALRIAPQQATVQAIQAIIMLLTLVMVLFYNRFVSFHFSFHSLPTFCLVGILLGTLSTFLGIGGGPINVACLIFFFGMEIKSATVYSIITIFFSQLAKLVSIGTSTGFGSFDLSILWAIIPAALLGGYFGGFLSKKLTDQRVTQLYNGVISLVILLNLYNLYAVLH